MRPERLISDSRVRAILCLVKKNDSVLDVGCVNHSIKMEERERNDWLHYYLTQKAREVLGIDIAKKEVAVLKNRGYNVIYEDAERMRLGRQFDIIVAGEIIEHLSNPGLFLDSAVRHLLPGGRLILSTPNPFCIPRLMCVLRTGKIPELNPQHTCWFEPETLSQLISRHGLHLSKVIYIHPRPSLAMRILRGLFQGFLGWQTVSSYGIVYEARLSTQKAKERERA